MNNSEHGSMHFYLVAVVLALAAFALGIWDILVQAEGGDWLMQILLPVLLIIVLAGLHAQAKRQRIAAEQAEAADFPDDGSRDGAPEIEP
ncbi:MAG: hypothetical protein ACE5FP_02560 [Gemmatimonadota bacterium]